MEVNLKEMQPQEIKMALWGEGKGRATLIQYF